MKVYHLNIIATKEDREELNRVGWDGAPRFTMHADITMASDADAAMAAFTEGFYKEVCSLRNDLDLEQAFEITQNINKPWDPAGIHRSTSVGDIIEKDGRFYLVASFGFTELEQLSAA